MNERVKELYAEAVMSVHEAFIDRMLIPSKVDLEFAEMIIRECGQWWTNRLIVEPDYGLPHRIERNRAVPGVIKEFNTHFGVEE
jgi:hypothetical protein